MLLASSGCRLSAIPSIKLHNMQDNGNGNDNKNKVTIYENTKEEYFTFITPECKKAIDSYLDMRSRYGEKLDDNSPLIREEFNVRVKLRTAKPKSVTAAGLRFKLDIISKKAGVRSSEVPLVHGFRKFFTTQLVNPKINPEIREMLLGHKIGLTSAILQTYRARNV